MMETRCPECRSEDVIEWDDGWLCRDCGCEFDDPDQRRRKRKKESASEEDGQE